MSMKQRSPILCNSSQLNAGLPIGEYRQLMAALDSPYCSPFKREVMGIKGGYRDPTRFRYTAIERPRIQPAKPFNLLEGRDCTLARQRLKIKSFD